MTLPCIAHQRRTLSTLSHLIALNCITVRMCTHHTHAANFAQGSHQMRSEWGHSVSKSLGDVRNHNSVGMNRPYLHKLSFDHLHYGVA
jgi:hypothetical protein